VTLMKKKRYTRRMPPMLSCSIFYCEVSSPNCLHR
jgi:hypothetical protein